MLLSIQTKDNWYNMAAKMSTKRKGIANDIIRTHTHILSFVSFIIYSYS